MITQYTPTPPPPAIHPLQNKVKYLEVLKSLLVSADPLPTAAPCGKVRHVLGDRHKTTGAAKSQWGQDLSSGGEVFSSAENKWRGQTMGKGV